MEAVARFFRFIAYSSLWDKKSLVSGEPSGEGQRNLHSEKPQQIPFFTIKPARELRTGLARKIAFFIGPKDKLITNIPGLLLFQ